MDKSFKKKFSEAALKVGADLAVLCIMKNIDIIDDNKFVINNRGTILNYHTLTGDYKGIFMNLLKGKTTLNETQLEEYQRKNFIKCNGRFNYNIEDLIYTDID